MNLATGYVSVSEFKQHSKRIVDQLKDQHAICLLRNSKPVGMLISMEMYRALIEQTMLK